MTQLHKQTAEFFEEIARASFDEAKRLLSKEDMQGFNREMGRMGLYMDRARTEREQLRPGFRVKRVGDDGLVELEPADEYKPWSDDGYDGWLK